MNAVDNRPMRKRTPFDQKSGWANPLGKNSCWMGFSRRGQDVAVEVVKHINEDEENEGRGRSGARPECRAEPANKPCGLSSGAGVIPFWVMGGAVLAECGKGTATW